MAEKHTFSEQKKEKPQHEQHGIPSSSHTLNFGYFSVCINIHMFFFLTKNGILYNAFVACFFFIKGYLFTYIKKQISTALLWNFTACP